MIYGRKHGLALTLDVFTPKEANGAAVKACHLDDLMNEVMAFAGAVNKGRGILKTMKEVTFKDIMRIMEVDDPGYLAGGRERFST